MREIEFRGKFNDGKWHYGDLVKRDYWCTVGWWCCDTKTVGEFTGLRDLHGVKAFEGDVIRILTEGETTVERDLTLYLIEWDSPRFGAFSPGHIKTVWDWGTFEIVGNIHDDPQLKVMFHKE